MLGSHREILDHINDKLSQSCTAMFKALLPKMALTSQLEGHAISPKEDFSQSIISSLLVYAVSNNFAGFGSLPRGMILNFFRRQEDSHLLQSIQHVMGPEAEAFAENLLPLAIESKDASIVEVLLNKRLDPNSIICNVDGRRYTPIERSSKLHSIEITSLLLRNGAEVNKTFGNYDKTCGALENALEGVDRQSVPSRELLRMILDAGSVISDRVVQSALKHDYDERVLAAIICLSPEVTQLALISKGILEKAAEWFDDEMAIRTVESVLHICGNTIDGYSPGMLESLQSALDAAARKGNLELVKFLLLSRIDMTRRTLSQAIRSTNKDLIWFLLDVGADVDIPADRGWTPWHITDTTPLAQAIRWGDDEVMTVMECKGAWSQIEESSRFQAALEAASRTGQLPIVKRLLGIIENVDEKTLGSALWHAMKNNHEVVALALLHAGGCSRRYFNLCLAYASGKGQVKVVQRLLDTTEDINPKDLWTAFLAAIEKEHATIALMLLNAGVSVERSGNEYSRDTPLVTAIKTRNANLVRLILDADVNFRVHINDIGSGDPVLAEACEWGNHLVIQSLIANGAEVNAVNPMGYSPFSVSVKRKDYGMIQLLLDAGADVNNSGSKNVHTPLEVAARSGDLEMIKYILSIGGDPNDSVALSESLSQATTMTELLLTAFSRTYPHGRKGYGWGALLRVIRARSFRLIEILLKAVDAPPLALGAAIQLEQDQNLDILRRLLQAVQHPNSIVKCSPYKADTGSLSDERVTALLAAIDTHNVQKVQLLIDAGADVNWPATRGVRRTPLQRAAEIGDAQLTQLLLQQGASVNAPPAANGGGTALQLAAIGGYVGIAELLLENDADVDARAAVVSGRTALEGAAEYGRIDMIKLLLNVGVKTQGVGQRSFGRALLRAQRKGHPTCRIYLETHSDLSAQDFAQALEKARREIEEVESKYLESHRISNRG